MAPWDVAGSYMRAYDRPRYWSYYSDDVLPLTLHASPASGRVLYRSSRLSAVLEPRGALDREEPFSFHPPALTTDPKSVISVGAAMTGGRTFLLDSDSAGRLGWPELALNLESVGWGNGNIELRYEVKGAGTRFERTRLSPKVLRAHLRDCPALATAFAKASGHDVHPVLYASLAEYMRRNLGFQSERFAMHSARTSDARLGTSGVKFVPVWLAVGHAPDVDEAVAYGSQVLDHDVPRFDGASAVEVRLTPSTVRAVYLDRCESDTELAAVCERISPSWAEVDESADDIVHDVRRYLEHLVRTKPAEKEGFSWIKIGDISEKFRRDEGQYRLAEGYKRQRFGWYLLKDTVVARRVGAFFCDLEGYYGRDTGYLSACWDDLLLHHELVILNVLRDHVRLLAQLRIGVLLMRGRAPGPSLRVSVQRDVWAGITKAINAAGDLHFELTPEAAFVTVHYRSVGQSHTYRIRREFLAERYA